MRLVGNVSTEKQALDFLERLKKERIKALSEPFSISTTSEKGYHIWVYDEDDVEKAIDLLEEYQQNGYQAQSLMEEVLPEVEEGELDFRTEDKGPVLKIAIRKKRSIWSYLATYVVFLVSILLFLVNTLERKKIGEEYGKLSEAFLITPLQKILLFDYPAAMQAFESRVKEIPSNDSIDPSRYEEQIQKIYKETDAIPYWRGFYAELMHIKKNDSEERASAPLFEKIREGEVWRIFTPAFIHADFLHILFNIAWLWVLGRQIETRIGRWRWLVLILAIAAVSNVAQYITTGPYFMGLSGIVVGMAGFIWSRQKKAPWEGYPLQRNTLLFIVFFVLIMFLLEIASFLLSFFSLANLTPNIANTAHVVGGLVGAYLGRLNFFSRGDT